MSQPQDINSSFNLWNEEIVYNHRCALITEENEKVKTPYTLRESIRLQCHQCQEVVFTLMCNRKPFC